MASRASTSAVCFPATSAAVRIRQWTCSAEAACAAAGRRALFKVSDRKAAFGHRLQELVLELLAAIILIAIFLTVTDPETRNDPDVGDSSAPPNF
jgi:hypothetical protein